MNFKFVMLERYSFIERKIMWDFEYINIYERCGILSLWLTN